MKKLFFQFLAVEVTRRCNMGCPHCMRGDAQCKDLNLAHIAKLLRQTKAIGELTFTGGEPTLNVPAMRRVLELCKELNVSVYSFYVVTNGKEITTDFLNCMIDWYVYCIECGGEVEYCGVALSQDEFHDDIPPENAAKLRALSFFRPDDKKTRNWGKTKLINLGRAKEITDHEKQEPFEYEVCASVSGNEIDVESYVALTIDGDLLSDCDYEYEDTDRLFICNVKDATETFCRVTNDPDFKPGKPF